MIFSQLNKVIVSCLVNPLCSLKVHCHFLWNLLLDPLLSQMNFVQAFTPCLIFLQPVPRSSEWSVFPYVL